MADTLNTAVGTTETVATTQAPAHAEKPNLLAFDPGVAVLTLITFLVLLGVLKKFAWTPILNAIDERDRAIRDSLDEAEKVRHESRSAVEEQAKILSEAKAQASKIIREAEEAGKSLRHKLEHTAHEERARIMADTERLISQEREKALRELRETVVQLSLQATHKLIGANLDEAKARELVDQQISKL